MSLQELLLAFPFTTVFDGEPDPEPEPKPEPEPEPKKSKEKIQLDPKVQAYVNSLLAEERRRGEQKNNDLITQLETEKNRAGTTAAEKEALEQRIDSLKSEYATKEELKTRETTKKVNELEAKNKQLAADGVTWKTRYERDRKRIDLTQAAVSEKAYNPSQVVNELFRNSRLEEVLDEDGKGTGEFETKIKLPTRDKDGKAVTLDLNPVEAVKQLKEQQEFANLFVSSVAGGLGGGNLGKGAGSGKAPHEMSPAEYIEWRKKNRNSR